MNDGFFKGALLAGVALIAIGVLAAASSLGELAKCHKECCDAICDHCHHCEHDHHDHHDQQERCPPAIPKPHGAPAPESTSPAGLEELLNRIAGVDE